MDAKQEEREDISLLPDNILIASSFPGPSFSIPASAASSGLPFGDAVLPFSLASASIALPFWGEAVAVDGGNNDNCNNGYSRNNNNSKNYPFYIDKNNVLAACVAVKRGR